MGQHLTPLIVTGFSELLCDTHYPSASIQNLGNKIVVAGVWGCIHSLFGSDCWGFT
jgi:hypothetical protein